MTGDGRQNMMSVKKGSSTVLFRGGAVALATLMLAACATSDQEVATNGTSVDHGAGSGGETRLASALHTAPNIDDPDAAPGGLVEDPFEDWNRFVFDLNTLIYTLIQPVIAPYGVLPDERKRNVDNFVHNLSTPVILVNDLLQGEPDRAWVTTQRFVINTAGGLGFFDPATDMGLPRHSEDFGQTLGVWGVGDGPYMVYPIIGPSNPRDGFGRIVDLATDPLFWLSGPTAETLSYSKAYVSNTSTVGANVPRLEELRANSLDFYAAVRSLYTQSRRAAVGNQEDGPARGAALAPPGAAFDPDTFDDGSTDETTKTDGSDAAPDEAGPVAQGSAAGETGPAEGEDVGLGPQALRIHVRANTAASSEAE